MKETIIIIVGAGALAVAACFASYSKGRADQVAETEAARGDLRACVARGQDKDATIGAQNAAVDGWKAAAEAKGEAAATALALAREASDRGRADVARILSAKAPVGKECEAAEALIRKEMGE